MKKSLFCVFIILLLSILFCFSCSKKENNSYNNVNLGETQVEDVSVTKSEKKETAIEYEKETNSFISNAIPPSMIHPLLHNDFITFMHLLEKDDVFVKSFLRQNYGTEYMSGLDSKDSIIDMIDTMEDKGFAMLKKPEKYQYGWLEYYTETCSEYIYEGLFFTHYIIDDMIYKFRYSENCEKRDYTHLERYQINKTFTFDGTEVVLYSFYDRGRPFTAGRYGGTCIKDDYSVEILVRNCSDINDINLEQFEWMHNVSSIEKLDVFKNVTKPDLPPC